MKNQKGITLIEIIVVAVIVGILASVGIPIYSGYIRDQRQTTVNNLAETAAASANSYLRRTGTYPTNVQNNLQLYYNASQYNVVLVNNGNLSVTEIRSSPLSATRSY